MDFSPKISKLSKIRKSCNMNVILNLFNNLLLGYYRRKCHGSLRLILLTRHFGGANSSKAIQVCYIYGILQQLFEKALTKQSIFFRKKIWKTWLSYISWLWYKSWRPCRHHGMIMTMFRHDHGMMMAWQPCFSNPGGKWEYHFNKNKYYDLRPWT